MSKQVTIVTPVSLVERFNDLKARIQAGHAAECEAAGARMSAHLLALVERRVYQIADAALGE